MKKVICLTILIIAVIYINRPMPTLVEVEETSLVDVYSSINVSGKLSENKSSYITSTDSGEIINLLVSEGDFVEKGDTLAIIKKGSIEESISLPTFLDEEMLASVFTAFESDEKYVYVKSNISGKIMSVWKEKGDNVSSYIPFIKISDLSKVYVTADVSETLSSQISQGMEADITVGSVSYTGTVEKINSYATTAFSLTSSSSPATVQVKIALDAINLDPGFSASVKIYTDVSKDAVVVPFEAIVWDDDMEFVYTVVDGKAYKKQVELGYDITDGIEVKNGLSLGEVVILNPEDVKAGDEVEIIEK